jgi:hypothetical protein
LIEWVYGDCLIDYFLLWGFLEVIVWLIIFFLGDFLRWLFDWIGLWGLFDWLFSFWGFLVGIVCLNRFMGISCGDCLIE